VLRYVNCGHLPPVLLVSDGSIQRLSPTAPVIGLFERWSCDTREVRLRCDDTLVMFTDGVVEALDADQQEFGDERLVEFLRQHAAAPAAALVGRHRPRGPTLQRIRAVGRSDAGRGEGSNRCRGTARTHLNTIGRMGSIDEVLLSRSVPRRLSVGEDGGQSSSSSITARLNNSLAAIVALYPKSSHGNRQDSSGNAHGNRWIRTVRRGKWSAISCPNGRSSSAW